jgi:hypothetical protein
VVDRANDGNTLLDMAVGSVPVVGDAFDALFRSNMKTMALLIRGEALRTA